MIALQGLQAMVKNETACFEYLRNKIRSLIAINDPDLETIVARFRYRKIAKDDMLLREGGQCDFWGFVHTGLLRVYTHTDTGEEYTNGFAREDSFVTESSSFFSQVPSLENFFALEDTEIVYIDHPKLQKLYLDLPDFNKFARILYESRLAEIKKRIMHRIHFDAQSRYLYFIKNQPELARRVPLKYIASYLSVTDSTLSRIRRKIVHA